jgi:hypothetical protein
MAAGLGFKTFTTGEVLTAADVNGYLMQGLLVFANAAARDAAITSPQEGQACYLKDTDAVLTYSGTAWVGFDDSNAIQNSIINAKGDLIAGSANDTPAILAAGNNGETLVADSAATTGLRWQPDFSVGRNKIINGDFSINQRQFTSVTTNTTFLFDRYVASLGGTSGTTTFTPENFTLGAAPVAGYEGKQYLQCVTSGHVNTDNYGSVFQKIESVRTFAGQTITVSFWAKAASGTPKVGIRIQQNFGSGGSPSSAVNQYATISAISTSWARYSATFTLGSLSGKTIGTSGSDSLTISLVFSAGTATFDAGAGFGDMLQNNTFGVWGLQTEAGNVATAFQTATGTLQGELAACQRYYYVLADAASQNFGTCAYFTATDVLGTVFFPVTMRTAPTFSAASGSYYEVVRNSASDALSGLQGNFISTRTANVFADSGNGASGTAGHGGQYRTTSASANIAFSAEL